MSLKSGRYYLLNDDGQSYPVGNEGPIPLTKPVVRVKNRVVVSPINSFYFVQYQQLSFESGS